MGGPGGPPRPAPMTYSLVLPFHRDVSVLGRTVARAMTEGAGRGVREVLLCHNGEPLPAEAQAVVEGLVTGGEADAPEVRYLHTNTKGIGAGYKLGIDGAREPFVILSADDLPFGWTDLDAFEAAGRPEFAIGSKAHPASRVVGIKTTRRLSTRMFLSLRRILLGAATPGDSQGSLILRTATAKRLRPDLEYDHYLCSLELATLHLRQGGSIVELPIDVEMAGRESSVSVVRDGLRMTLDLVKLRRRMDAA